MLHDASLRHEAWMQLFCIHKQPVESYLDLYRRIDNARSRIGRITPATQTKEQRSNEIALFSLLSALPVDDPLRRQLVAQKDVTLDLPASLVLHLSLQFCRSFQSLSSVAQMAISPSRTHDPTTACVRVERARLRAAPEAPKSCPDSQYRSRGLD